MNKIIISRFTLIETVIAIAILAMAMVGILGITVNASKRMGKAMSNWKERHMLSQAAEYYLLAGPKESIPREFFPFDGYRSECIIEIPVLPGEVKSEAGAWRFVTLKISVYKEGEGTPVDTVKIDKIFRAEDIE